MPYLAGYVTPQDYGAAGDGVTDDTAALNTALAALNAAGGGTLFMPAGTRYLVSGTISVPPLVFLQGPVQVSLNLGTLPPSMPRILAASGWAPSSTAGIVSFQSKTPGGWSVTAQSSGLKNIAIDGNGNASANLNGILFQGPVYDTHLEDVYIVSAPHNGVHAVSQSESGITATFPYHQRWNRVTTNLAANTGFNLVNFTDSSFSNCLAFASVANNWALQNNSNSVFTACRAEWSSAGRGWDITGSAGSVVLDSCTTDQNFDEGVRIHAATGQSNQGGGLVISGGKFHADGNAGGSNSNGIKITGSTVPITITGVNVESGFNTANAAYYPVNAVEIDTSSNVDVAGSILQGVTSAWSDGGGNTNILRKGCIGMTGNPNTQTTTMLQDLPFGVPQVQSSATTVTGVTAETVLQTYTVPANEPVAGAVYHMTGYGVFTAASGTLAWTVRWGGTSGTLVASLPANTAPVLTNGSFWYDVMLTFRSTTSVTASINLELGSSTSTDAATSYNQVPSSATTVTTSSSTALTVDVTPSVSGTSVTLMGGCTRKLA